MAVVLFLSVFLIAACGLIYELIAGTLASYLLGDSVLQFSTVIGSYLFAMGIGSWLSRFLDKALVARFITIELMVGLLGGFSSTILFLAFTYTHAFQFLLYGMVIAIGILVGLEIPLLMRILRERFNFKELVANVLTFDYLGALGASLLFPLILVPKLGLVRSAILFGLINAGVALWSTFLFKAHLPSPMVQRAAAIAVVLILCGGLATADYITDTADAALYSDEVIFAKTTPYQRMVVTKWKQDYRLYLNSHLQFSSRDEYRYHESLVHPGLASVAGARHALVLGGGDGLAVREMLKYPGLQTITMVDLDPEMTRQFSTHPLLVELNSGSLKTSKLKIINADAFPWLEKDNSMFDFVVVDFPDPNNYSLGKLYTTAFYRLLRHHVAQNGVVVVQSTSPMFARQSFWCINETMKQAGFKTYPFHVYVPSFGEWGYVLGAQVDWKPPTSLPAGLKFLTPANVASLFEFPPDLAPVAVEANRLNDQTLVRYYEHEWREIVR
ncbi:MAG: polyamine aminopropyltransferase [Bryobacterales bacterium]|nr:polyamine aminopropyltransferase [Bryobacterales bacterium]